MPVRLRRTVVGAISCLALLTACGSPNPSASGGDAGSGGAFPVELTHKFGTTTIESRPERVVAIGYNEQDFALAVGVVPVGVREFIGYDAPQRPWAQKQLRGKELPTVGSQELDLEKIAALEPDLILGVNSYIDARTYRLLSKIAPTVAQTDEYADGATPWAEQTRTTGKALGREERAEDVIAKTQAAFDRAVDAHPEFEGKSASFALGEAETGKGGAYALGTDDYRTGWLTDLGFTVRDKSGEISEERLDTFDTDVVVLEGAGKGLEQNPVFTGLDAVQAGRVADLGQFDDDFAGALGFNSPLSLPYVLDVAVPRLADAVDGDPATKVEPYP